MAHQPTSMQDKLGICQWFHYQAHEDVHQTVELMHDLGVKHLRTGISWADYYRDGGKAWYDWQMNTLSKAGLELLVSVWHTPPSISEGEDCASPPRDLRAYADFIDLIITDYGHTFEALELWNEPNNRYKWNFPIHDPEWRKFGEMIGNAAYWAKQRGKTTVLGGMIPVDHHWLGLMRNYGVLDYIDVVAIHAFPGMWWEGAPNWDWHEHWQGWEQKLEYIARHASGKPVWVTETGLATWDLATERLAKHDLQVTMLEKAAAASTERLYWYCLVDLHPEREAIEGFHVDENEYHMGLVTFDGRRKPAYEWMKALMAEEVLLERV